MIDKKDFKTLVKDFESLDEQRELLIKKSRDVLKLSKQLIYALHRDDVKTAKNLKAKIQATKSKLNCIALKRTELQNVGAYRVAIQEYVEALCYYSYIVNNKIPTHKELKVSAPHYLLGVCDLTGELVRKAINDAIKGDLKSAIKIKGVVEELYGELLQFDFRGGETRKKFDGIKYDLKRLEDIALSITLK